MRVHMLTTKRTQAGLLKQGKNYPVPDDLGRELESAGDALNLDGEEPERAVKGPEEDAAGRSHRPELPFRPTEHTVDELPRALETVEDVGAVHRLQRIDTRKTAAAHYERRVDELEGRADG